jgi:hypothetical protein
VNTSQAPVPVEEREITSLTEKGEHAASVIVRYMEMVAEVYKIDIRWLGQRVSEKLRFKVRD